jgi:acetyl-CoA synthetase
MVLYTEYMPGGFTSYEDFKQNFRLNIPESFNFAYDVVDKYAEKDPDKLALAWCNPEGEEKYITFKQMKEYSDKAAAFFQSLGIKKGDNVMLILKRRYEFWFTIVALHKLGAVAIPATHQLMVKDIVYRIKAASVKMIVSVNEHGILRRIDEAVPEAGNVIRVIQGDVAREGWLPLNRGMAEAPAFSRPAERNKNTDIMLAYFTSGTTGMPKLVEQNYLYPLGHLPTAIVWHQVRENKLHLTVSDTGWGKAVWGKIYAQWLGGAAIMAYDFDRFVPSDLLGIVEKYKVATFCAPPTIYRYLVHEDLSAYDLSSIEYCTTAGEALNPEVFNKWKRMTGLEIREGFGQTETTLVLATFPWVDIRPGSMGVPSPLYKVALLDEEGNECETGEVGEICIDIRNGRPPGMFSGYRNDPELNNKVVKFGHYHTGDTAWKDENGYFWYVGRVDDIIKSSGYRIGPFEVESVLMEHPAVLECAITGAPDPIRGTVVKATIVLAKGYKPGDELVHELQEHVKKTTAPYKYPRIVEFTDELPKTISGKIRRVEIREKSKD